MSLAGALRNALRVARCALGGVAMSAGSRLDRVHGCLRRHDG